MHDIAPPGPGPDTREALSGIAFSPLRPPFLPSGPAADRPARSTDRDLRREPGEVRSRRRMALEDERVVTRDDPRVVAARERPDPIERAISSSPSTKRTRVRGNAER